jgi:hypothetical protein
MRPSGVLSSVSAVTFFGAWEVMHQLVPHPQRGNILILEAQIFQADAINSDAAAFWISLGGDRSSARVVTPDQAGEHPRSSLYLRQRAFARGEIGVQEHRQAAIRVSAWKARRRW